MKKYLALITGFIAAGSLMLVAAPAAARVNVDVFIGMPVYAQPAPVYAYPQPVYVQPQPVYVAPRPIYVQPQPVYIQPHPRYSDNRRGHYRGHERRGNRGHYRDHRPYGY